MKTCENCDKEIRNASRTSKKYCSDNCRKAANARKNKEARKETNRKYYEKTKNLKPEGYEEYVKNKEKEAERYLDIICKLR